MELWPVELKRDNTNLEKSIGILCRKQGMSCKICKMNGLMLRNKLMLRVFSLLTHDRHAYTFGWHCYLWQGL